MDFPQPLTHGVLVSRYKRFFADVTLDDGREITAHCPNPGAMLGVNLPGMGVWLSRSDDPRRKLAWTLEMVESGGGLVGVNTIKPHVCRQGLDTMQTPIIRRRDSTGGASLPTLRHY